MARPVLRFAAWLAAAFGGTVIVLALALGPAHAETAADAAAPAEPTPAMHDTEPSSASQGDLPPRDGASSLPSVVPAGPAGYRALAEAEARNAGLPPEVADSVMAVESGYNPGAIGGAGEIGLMQILPSTARMLGFSGTATDLATPQTNIHYGVTYLAQAWRLAAGDICTAVMKYRAGHGQTRFSYRSVDYCLAVRAKLIARGYHVTGNVPVATSGESTASAGSIAGCRRRCLGGGAVGHVNLAALNTQLSALVMQVRVKQ